MNWVDVVKMGIEVGGAAVAVIGWLNRKLVVPHRLQMAGLEHGLAEINKELKTNGGNSLRDEIKAIRLKVEASAARFLAFGSESTVGCFISAPDGSCTWVNRQYLRITERTEGEALGWGWKNIIHPEDFDRVEREWESAIEEDREYHSTHRYITPEGRAVQVYVHASPVRDSSGKIIEHIGFVRGYDESCAFKAECLGHEERRKRDADRP